MTYSNTTLYSAWDTNSLAPSLRQISDGDTTSVALTLPSGIAGKNIKTVFVDMNNSTYIVGTWEDVLVYTPKETVEVAGILPPRPPSLAASGSGSLRGTMVPYLTALEKDSASGQVLVESNPVIGTSVEFNDDGNRVWTIPATAPSSRTTHIRGYVSVAGGLPRLAVETTLGTTSVTEDKPTAFLAQQPTLPNDGSGGLVFNNMPPPPGVRFAIKYHRRMFYAGDANHPGRIWWSELDKPEAVGNNSWAETRDQEPITGLGRWNDQIVVFCDGATYELQGWSDGSDGTAPDLRLNKLITGPGCISHHSIKDINDRLWYADRDGIRVYDGGFRYVSKLIRTAWRTDFDSNESAYLECHAEVDDFYNTYNLLVPKSSAFYWIGHYLETDPVMGGAGRDPWWTNDKRNRKDRSIGAIKNSDGSTEILYGSADGYLRSEDATDNNDDSDSLAKQITLELHRHFGYAGQDIESGLTLREVYSVVQSPDYPYNLTVYGGDETALDQASSEARSEEVAASATASKVDTDIHVHNFEPIAGRNFGFKWTTNTTDGVDTTFRFRGLGYTITADGPAKRGASA